MKELQLIKTDLLPSYMEQVHGITEKFNALREAEISTDSFSFYTSVASVFSSKIEGEDIELDSYIKHKAMHFEFKPDFTKKTDDLYNAYQFAQSHPMNAQSTSEVHTLLSKNIVETHKQGQLRTNIMYVATDDGRIAYVPTSPYELKAEMDKWYADAEVLLSTAMSAEEVFFFASCF